MSLQIWLPLNGNLKNNGCDGGTVSSVNASTSTSGKIGSCYSFNGSSSYLLGTHSFLSNSTPDWSFACWMKLNSTSAGQCLFSCRTVVDQKGIAVFYYGSTWLIDDGVRWQFTPTVTIAANRWYHVCVVHKKDVGKYLYINGSLDSSTTTTSTPTVASTTNFTIGNSQTSSTVASGNPLNGYLNDVRVYDHALSIAEIKEISKGLVCHYKLDNAGKGNDNLVSRTNTADTSRFGYSEQTGGSTKTIEYDNGTPCIKVTRNSTPHSGWAYMWNIGLATSLIKTSTTYTVSFDVIASGNGTVSFNGFMQGNATNSMSASTQVIQGSFNATSWSHIVLRTTTKDSFDGITIGSQVVYMGCWYLTNTEVWLMMKNMKVEEGATDTAWCPYLTDDKYVRLDFGSTAVADNSGFGNNGTKTGTITNSSDAPRYSSSTKFASGSHINATLVTSGFANSYTFSWWGKYSNYSGHMMWGFSNGNRLNLYMSGGNFYWNTGDGNNNPFNISAATYGDNQWHHFAITGDGTTTKLYIDGEFKANAKTYRGITGTTIYLNGWDSGTNYNFNGQLSDFRLYATVLSADDIKRLYEVSASVSKNGSMLGYEMKEG